MGPRLRSIFLNDSRSAWVRAGFHVDGNVIRVGPLDFVLTHRQGVTTRPDGATGWAWEGVTGESVAGLSTACVMSGTPRQSGDFQPHKNGVVDVDHVVLRSRNLKNTMGLLAQAGLEGGSTEFGFIFGICHELGPLTYLVYFLIQLGLGYSEKREKRHLSRYYASIL